MECIGCRESWLGGFTANLELDFSSSSSCSQRSACRELDGRILFRSRKLGRIGYGGYGGFCLRRWKLSSSSSLAAMGERSWENRRRSPARHYMGGRRREWEDGDGGDVRERERIEWPMHVDRISSVTNHFVRQCVRLRQSRSYRNERGVVLVVGRIPLSEIISAWGQDGEDGELKGGGVEIEVLMLLEGLPMPEDMPARQTVYVTPSVMRKLSGVESAEGVEMVAILRKPASFTAFGPATISSFDKAERWCPSANRLLALDGVQDPGNLGTLLRTAAALGWDGVFLLPGCCDPFNEKAIRASRGAAFHIPVAVGDWSQLRAMLSRRRVACYSGEPHQPLTSSSMRSSPDAMRKKIDRASLEDCVCLILGSEGQGLSQEAREVSQPLAVPMEGHLESLNVAVAGGILMLLLLILVVLLLLLVLLFRVCILGNVPPRQRKRRSSMKDARMEARQAIPRSGGEQVGGRRCGGSLSTVGRASQRVGYDALPPHLQPLPGSSDEEEVVERRPQTVSLGSGSTQEWTATELCGTSGDMYEQSFTELLRPGLGEDEGDGRVNLSFGLSTRRSTTPSRTVLVRPHPDDEGGQLTVVDRSARTRALASETAGTNRNSSMPQPRAASLSKGAQGRGIGVDGGTDFLDVGNGRDGREVWRDLRRDHRLRREEYITRGVERLHVGDRENENETDDPPAEADDDYDDDDDDDNDDDNDVECGEGGSGHASPSLQSDMAGKGGKSKPSGRNARPRAKKGQGKGSGGEGDGDAEEKRNFWSVEHIIALIRAKRDQDAHMQGMGHAYARMKPREWKWQDVAQRLKNVGVDRNAEKCGKKWDNLMQQFKKVHHFQSPSGGADFFQLTSKERASRGFNFTMDRAVYDEIEGSTGMNHTIHPKNVADTGESGGVRPPSTSYVDPESVADGEGGAGREDDEEGSTRGSLQTTGTPGGSGKRKSTRQQTFEALTECMEKHDELMPSTMESASKRQCSIQEGATSHETAQRVLAPLNRPRTPAANVAGSSHAAVEGGTLRSPAVVARGGAVAVSGEAVEVPKGGGGAAAGEDDEALVHRLRGQRAATHAMDAAAKLWEDDNRFWNDTQGSAIVRIIQEARAYLVAVARRVQPPAIRRSISLPHNSIPQHKIEDESELNAAKERALKVQTISLRAIHGWVFKSESWQRGYHLAYQYALNHAATDIARAMWSAEDWRSLVSPMLFRTTLDVDMKLPLWFVGVNIVDRHEDDECGISQAQLARQKLWTAVECRTSV
ncbi:hypothetical protein CBR_g31860 [Chara braunii]|uniref:Myb-like domain-containing protein n=1 Tax=Chara braunii TaxID=69332 RepID=A0A388LFU4_CHABU|nr:hypothetical protein CBR_g31860 [Chara braunii]|eukprot:GBG81186.1 hypothetical protein CBR_g31860 [Chara braunii]